MGTVEAADVGGWISLGIDEPLRRLPAWRKRQPLLIHARQDVVAGAVEDAVDAGNLAAAQPLAQRLHDRDAAGHGRFKAECRVALLGEPRQRSAVTREQCLV